MSGASSVSSGYFRCCIAASLLITARLQAQDPQEFFESKVRPLLASRCHACHGPKQQMGGLDLSTAQGLYKATNGGPLIVKGNPSNSRLIQAVNYLGTIKMPPIGKLSEQEISDLTAWVKMGAPWSRTDAPSARKQADFWSFRPVQDYPPPAVRNKAWIQTPIDNFILAKLEENGFAPAPAADKPVLLRRVTFDLTGLPPTEKEIRDFLADDSPQAFARVVERLLASPRYGERWGRYWLDVARYADTTGADEDEAYPHAWRYRDYVIDAFNRDLPYDRFVTEQLAGDLLPAAKADEVNANGIVATGFVALGPKLLAEQDKPKMLYDLIDEQIDVTSRALLGLTVACARCHDHKFDPIPTRDYYSLASIFASTKSLSKIEGTVSKLYFAPLVAKDIADRYQAHQEKTEAKKLEIDEIIEDETARHAERLTPRLPDYMVAAWRVYQSGAPASRVAEKQQLDPHILQKWIEYLKPNKEYRPHLDPWYKADLADLPAAAKEYRKRFEATSADWERTRAEWKKKAATARESGIMPPEKPKFEPGKDRFFAEISFGKGPFALPEKEPEQEPYVSGEAKAHLAILRTQLEALKEASPPEPPMACAVAEGQPVRQHVFLRGSPANPGEEVPKGFLTVLGGNQPPITHGSGRLELARWLTEPNHPLTARVMVNRIWQWHFGAGIVRTPSNYGQLGDKPTHPELLDYLAKRFMESKWSIKAMHRLILFSSAYQMSSEITREKMDLDPANRWLSHFNRRRLDVEEIRDTFLALDGSLDLTMGGPMPEGLVKDVEFSTNRMSFDPDNSRRRTVYLPLRRSNLPNLLNLFDFGDATTTGEGRASTNVAPQALFMMNSKFATERARGLAKYLVADTDSDEKARVERAYLVTLGVKPGADEVKAALEYVSRYPQAPPAAAWESFCHILLASNDFIYVD